MRLAPRLLPAGVTDLVQLVDAGFGKLVKDKAGKHHTAWMIKDDNQQRWVDGMKAWEIRAHITHVVHLGYDEACKSYDFEKNARKVGMLMTIGEEQYEGVNIQGLGPITFTDAEGGSEGNLSDDGIYDDEEESVTESLDLAAARDEKEADVEYDAVESDNDVDDTDLQCEAAIEDVGGPVAMPGFKIDHSELNHVNDIIGKSLLVKLIAPPLEESEYGWNQGTALRRHEAGFLVRFAATETSSVVSSRYNNTSNSGTKKRKKGEPHTDVPFDLTSETRGTNWCIITPVAVT